MFYYLIIECGSLVIICFIIKIPQKKESASESFLLTAKKSKSEKGDNELSYSLNHRKEYTFNTTSGVIFTKTLESS